MLRRGCIAGWQVHVEGAARGERERAEAGAVDLAAGSVEFAGSQRRQRRCRARRARRDPRGAGRVRRAEQPVEAERALQRQQHDQRRERADQPAQQQCAQAATSPAGDRAGRSADGERLERLWEPRNPRRRQRQRFDRFRGAAGPAPLAEAVHPDLCARCRRRSRHCSDSTNGSGETKALHEAAQSHAKRAPGEQRARRAVRCACRSTQRVLQTAPVSPKPSASLVASVRSNSRPATNGPRSTTGTRIERLP